MTNSLQFVVAISLNPINIRFRLLEFCPSTQTLLRSSSFPTGYLFLTSPHSYRACGPPPRRDACWAAEGRRRGRGATDRCAQGSGLWVPRPRPAFSFFLMALFHVTVNLVRSISDLGIVKQHLDTHIKERREIGKQNLRSSCLLDKVVVLTWFSVTFWIAKAHLAFSVFETRSFCTSLHLLDPCCLNAVATSHMGLSSPWDVTSLNGEYALNRGYTRDFEDLVPKQNVK